MIAPASSVADIETFRVVLIGGLYDEEHVRGFLAALGAWLGTLDPADREQVELVYAGASRDLLEAELAARPLHCRTRINGYLPLDDLGQLCRSAALNAYIWSPGTFHHKLLELLACRRPVLCFPGERPEIPRARVGIWRRSQGLRQ